MIIPQKYIFGLIALFITGIASAANNLHTHHLYQNVLSDFVIKGQIDYARLKAQPVELQSYLDQLAAVKKTQFHRWNQAQQMAFLLNLYNAATLQLIITHYPVESIKDIGHLFRNAWQKKFIHLFGKQVSLDYVEHDLLRAEFGDPRIHFALVCAARSCPPLRAEPYLAHKLEGQLNNQGHIFLADPSKNRVDLANKQVYLSKIFSWFKEDFRKDGENILDFVSHYLTADVARQVRQTHFNVQYIKYDWALNEIKRKRTATSEPTQSDTAPATQIP